MGVRRIDLDLCNGCGICFNNCPMDVFRWDDKADRPYIKYLRDCQSCFLCELECPTGAIYCFPTFERRVVTTW